MAALFMSLLGALRSTFRTRAELALENLALRQQLANLRHASGRPRIRMPDRAFWLILSPFFVQGHARAAPCPPGERGRDRGTARSRRTAPLLRASRGLTGTSFRHADADDVDFGGQPMPSGRGRFRAYADLVPDTGALVTELAFNHTYRPGFSPFAGPDDRLAKDKGLYSPQFRCRRGRCRLRIPRGQYWQSIRSPK
jgi:hypothetical protein